MELRKDATPDADVLSNARKATGTPQEGAGEAPGGIREVSAIQTASEIAPTDL
jgi:hypothetical protein